MIRYSLAAKMPIMLAHLVATAWSSIFSSCSFSPSHPLSLYTGTEPKGEGVLKDMIAPDPCQCSRVMCFTEFSHFWWISWPLYFRHMWVAFICFFLFFYFSLWGARAVFFPRWSLNWPADIFSAFSRMCWCRCRCCRVRHGTCFKDFFASRGFRYLKYNGHPNVLICVYVCSAGGVCVWCLNILLLFQICYNLCI